MMLFASGHLAEYKEDRAMSDDRISAAIEALLSELDKQQQEVAETKKTINTLRRRNGEEALFTDVEIPGSVTGTIHPSQFYGKPLSTAAREYLETRNRRACPIEDVMRAMVQGGFDFDALGWKEADRLRSLSISLAKNSSIFHRLPNGTFGLLAWYPDVEKKSAKGDRDKTQAKDSGTTSEESKTDTPGK